MDIGHDEARSLLDRIATLYEYEDPYDALALCDQATQFYATIPPSGDAAIEFERAMLTLWNGVALGRTGRLTHATESIERAMRFLSDRTTASQADSDLLYAIARVHLARTLRNDGAISKAWEALEHTPRDLGKAWKLGNERARLELSKALLEQGIILAITHRYDEAIETYAEILELLGRPDDFPNDEFGYVFAQALRKRAQAWRRKKEPPKAIEDLKIALALAKKKAPQRSQEWSRILAKVQVSLALARWDTGEVDEAHDLMKNTERLFGSEPLRERRDLNIEICRFYMNWAVVLNRWRKRKEALAAVDNALALASAEAVKGERDLKLTVARLLMNRGVYRRWLDDVEGALVDHRTAEYLFFSRSLLQRQDLDQSRARCLFHLARSLRANGQSEEATNVHVAAFERYNESALADRRELDSSRASILIAHANALLDQQMLPEALASYSSAEALLEGQTIGPWLPRNKDRCTLYASMSRVIARMTDPHGWARDKSRRMVEILELGPADLRGLWAEMRRAFLRFHARWLEFALSERGESTSATQDIILALQGRRMISEVLETALSETDAGTADPAIMDLARQRRLMRELLDELQRLEDPGASNPPENGGGNGGGSTRSRRGNRSVVDITGSFQGDPSVALEKLRKRLAKERQIYEDLKAVAAKVPGYEILAYPMKQITVERLQSGLGAEELLMLAFPLEGPDAEDAENITTSHLWVLGKTGDPRLVHAPTPSRDVAGVTDLAALFGRVGASLSAARGGVRKPPDRPGADKPEPLPEAMLGTAWSELERGLRQLIWAPLEASGALEGVSQVTVCTMGAFHNLPVASGAPEGLTVRSAGALPIFALSRGLYAGPGDEAGAPTRPAAAVEATIALLSDDDASADIPQTRVEIAASQRLWERARDGAVIRASRVPFAEAKGPVVRLAHTACHGDVDTSVTPPLPVLGLGCGVTERDLARRPAVEGWMFMACVVGQNFDDLIEGTPVGLVNGALRNGARTVVAFLSPVPDTIGLLTGLTITAQVSHRRMPLGAAADHARRVLDPTYPEDDPELMRLVAEALAAYRAEDFARELAKDGGTPAGLEEDVPEMHHHWTDFAGLAEALAGHTAPPSAADLAPILARHIHPRIPSETPKDRLRLGVLQHALVVFEGYPQD